jgi:hypothetical protein
MFVPLSYKALRAGDMETFPEYDDGGLSSSLSKVINSAE